MAAAAMAAAATSTRGPPSSSAPRRRLLLPIHGASAFSPNATLPESLVISGNSTLRSWGNPCESLLRYPSTSWSCGSRWEEFGLNRGSHATGVAGRWASRKKCGAAVVTIIGQQQQHYGNAVRDKVVEFGKFKGARMGTLTSRYLKWMVNNLKTGPMSEWSEYAKEVLADAYYKDRLEWEKVEKLMTAAHDVASITGNREVVLAPARIYGWDLHDDGGWRKVNFSLIGTTLGGRIPRTSGVPPIIVPDEEKKKAMPRKTKKKSAGLRTTTTTTTLTRTVSASLAKDGSSSSGSLRDELMRRRAQRRDRLMPSRRGLIAENVEAREAQQRVSNRLPGRESLLSTIRSYDISE